MLGDHLGSTSVTANSSGGKVAELRYHPWGGTRFSSGTTPTARRYTGQIEDAAIGLYFYNARFYDPALGRFLQADTIVPQPGNPQSLNRYAYVLNNPLRYTDPTGHAYCPPEANGRCLDEHEPTPPPLPIRFKGDWTTAQRQAVTRGAQALANAVFQVFLTHRHRFGQNMPLNSQGAFRMTLGWVTFEKAAQCGNGASGACVNPGAWAWSRIGTHGAVLVNNQVGYTGLAAELNAVHELAHGIDQRGGFRARGDLSKAHIRYVGEDGQDVQVAGGAWPRGYSRFSEGFFDWPWQQNTAPDPGEEWADMFIGWNHNHFTADSAGDARYRWMNTNMPGWIALAVAGR